MSDKKTSPTPKNLPKLASERIRGVGRPTFRQSGVEYVKIIVTVPLETKQLIRQALAGEYFGKYETQAELVDAAIRAFVRAK